MSVVFILKERNKYSYSVRTHSIIELSIHQRIWKKNDLSFHKNDHHIRGSCKAEDWSTDADTAYIRF